MDETMRRKGFSPYGPSKVAVESETAIWAQDLADTGVTVNAPLPGGESATGMIPPDVPEAIQAQLLPPEIMVPPLLWLVSRAADQVTGKQWQAVDYAPPSAADLQRIRETGQATRRRDAQLRGGGGGRVRGGRAQVADTSIGRCDEAKALRDRELYKLGPRRSIRQLRAWDDYIAKACWP